jgi:hypothetical protein
MRLSIPNEPISPDRKLSLLVVVIFVLVSSGCLFTFNNSSQNATLEAIQAQQTQLSSTGTSLAELGYIVASETPEITAIQEAIPTLTKEQIEKSTETQIAVATEEGTNQEDIDERLLKSSKILLFEDMSASRHIRYVKEALDRDEYFYLDVGSAKGWFKSQLLSSEDWDLIIASAESRSDFGGEFFQYIDDQVARGASTIIEFWDWDAAPMGKSKLILDRCGVSFQADWFEPEIRVFYWLAPENPIFNFPNIVPNQLGNTERIWIGDIGDLFEIKYKNGEPVGDAEILAGTNPTWKDDHGVLVSCLDGQMILQGFSSHEYRRQDIVPLWQNYIYQTLKSHYAQNNLVVPTPVLTAIPLVDATPEPTAEMAAPTPGPEYLLEHDCGGLMSARLMEAPHFQKDLFEHHAKGTFLILKLQLNNLTDFPIQIWDQDYFIEGEVNGKIVNYGPDKAATGYLYIESPSNLSQDLIKAGENWRTSLAFDVDPAGKSWNLVVVPGREFDQQVCEVRISLAK